MSTNARPRATPRKTRNNGTRAPGAGTPSHWGGANSRISTAEQRAAPTARTHPGAKRVATRRYQRIERQRRRTLLLKVGGAVAAAVVVLVIVYIASTSGASSAKPGQAGQYRFDVASPAARALAPDFTLPSTTGGTLRLSDFRGKTVLLYFQEGIGCEGCWTQMKDIQADMKDFQGLGIVTMLTVTTNPLDALKQKVADERLTLPVLSDESFAVSRAYNAMAYGMMAGSADGHTFILVGPDGRIRWRADYGGPPSYTMYVPVSNLIADIMAGTKT